MASGLKQIIVPKEDAVFWLDKNGIWHNEHGKFEHPKIIRYFNASIRKDKQGYHVCQVRDEFEEKVYFPYEDTALFVTDIKGEKKLTLTLNTTAVMALDPSRLFTKDDNLYVQAIDDCIKFTERALVKLSKFLEEKDGSFYLLLDNIVHEIPEK